MEKIKIIFTVLIVLFCLTVLSTVFVLSVNAERDPLPSPIGQWGDVCCGSACPNGVDYCVGNGTYVCCK